MRNGHISIHTQLRKTMSTLVNTEYCNMVCKDPDGNDLPPESDTWSPSDFRPAFTVEKTANQVVAQLDDDHLYGDNRNTGNVTLKILM